VEEGPQKKEEALHQLLIAVQLALEFFLICRYIYELQLLSPAIPEHWPQHDFRFRSSPDSAGRQLSGRRTTATTSWAEVIWLLTVLKWGSVIDFLVPLAEKPFNCPRTQAAKTRQSSMQILIS